MTTSRTEIPFILLALAVLAAIVILTLSNHPVPTYLWGVFLALISGGLGIAVPTSAASSVPVVPVVPVPTTTTTTTMPVATTPLAAVAAVPHAGVQP